MCTGFPSEGGAGSYVDGGRRRERGATLWPPVEKRLTPVRVWSRCQNGQLPSGCPAPLFVALPVPTWGEGGRASLDLELAERGCALGALGVRGTLGAGVHLAPCSALLLEGGVLVPALCTVGFTGGLQVPSSWEAEGPWEPRWGGGPWEPGGGARASPHSQRFKGILKVFAALPGPHRPRSREEAGCVGRRQGGARPTRTPWSQAPTPGTALRIPAGDAGPSVFLWPLSVTIPQDPALLRITILSIHYGGLKS